jgi:hypothetical protein
MKILPSIDKLMLRRNIGAGLTQINRPGAARG